MPQLIAVMIACAGLYAGMKWVSRFLQHQAEEARRQAEELERRTRAAARPPKDLGVLEYDAEARVYKPRTPRGV
jgi:hypothetical protein